MVSMINYLFKKLSGVDVNHVSYKELKQMHEAFDRAVRERDDYLICLERIIKLHKLAVALSTRSLSIIERIKLRYPYIFNECTDDEDTKFVVDLLRQITEHSGG